MIEHKMDEQIIEDMNTLLCIDAVRKSYAALNEEKELTEVLRGISFSVRENEFVAIMGKSGCGKTTLLKTLGLIHKPTEGHVIFKGKVMEKLWEDERADLRRREIGFVFQDFYLLDSLTIEENIMLPMVLDKREEEKCFAETYRHAEHFQITHLLKKYPYQLSGGEKQRAAICRALINEPELILADEPTGNLDSASGKLVVEALEHIHTNLGKTIIMVTHDPEVASHCDRVLFLKDGEILEDKYRTGGREGFYQEILEGMERLS